MPSLLVIGDSILWGQGLTEDDKCSRKLTDAWSAARQTPIEVWRCAHSGADIWDDGQSGILAALNPYPPVFPATFAVSEGAIAQSRQRVAVQVTGAAPPDLPAGEIPDEEPYLLAQLVAAGRALEGAPPDLVLVDMGINDTEIYNLVLPGKSTSAVVRRAHSLAPRVASVLERIGQTFPAAKVIVSGYYPVVSKESDASELFQFAQRVLNAALDARVSVPEELTEPFGLVGGLARDLATVFDDLVVPDLAYRCRAWMDATHATLSAAVATFDAGRHVAAFVDPKFQPEDAVFTKDSLLWPFKNGTSMDPMLQRRIDWCDERLIRGFDRLVIECATMGHPNPMGSAKYGRAIIAQAIEFGLFDS